MSVYNNESCSQVAKDICDAIRAKCPGMLINMSTGVVGDDLSQQMACLESVRPEMAALNAGDPRSFLFLH